MAAEQRSLLPEAGLPDFGEPTPIVRQDAWVAVHLSLEPLWQWSLRDEQQTPCA
jgi:hypothetical protein